MTDKTPLKTITARIKGAFDASGTPGVPAGAILWKALKVLSDGTVISTLVDDGGSSQFAAPFDGVNTFIQRLTTVNANLLFNGTTWDRERSNTEETYLASAARTATNNSADFTNYNARGLHAIVNVSAVTGAASITPTIQAKDPVSGLYYDLLVGLPITTVGTNVLKVYPGISPVLNASASDLLPRTYRLRIVHGTADSITYSVSGALVR